MPEQSIHLCFFEVTTEYQSYVGQEQLRTQLNLPCLENVTRSMKKVHTTTIAPSLNAHQPCQSSSQAGTRTQTSPTSSQLKQLIHSTHLPAAPPNSPRHLNQELPHQLHKSITTLHPITKHHVSFTQPHQTSLTIATMCTIHILKCPSCNAITSANHHTCPLTSATQVCHLNHTNSITTYILPGGCTPCLTRVGPYHALPAGDPFVVPPWQRSSFSHDSLVSTTRRCERYLARLRMVRKRVETHARRLSSCLEGSFQRGRGVTGWSPVWA
ncbi:hypothetical protein K456DRAFT_467031 [Colletotrichum gloeosporioides 23]|nr:hypothetical protein K456DRAFT_467031 [Colletotrichum gloeosporioides 23]